MRNKVYVGVICGILLALFIWCPVSFALHSAGVATVEDNKNYKDPEKVYFFLHSEGRVVSMRREALLDFEDPQRKYWYNEIDQIVENFILSADADEDIEPSPLAAVYMDTLNAIEIGKANLDGIYTNHLPFYDKLLDAMNSLNYKFQTDFEDMMRKLEAPGKKPAPTPNPTTTSAPDTTLTELTTTTEVTTATSQAAATTTVQLTTTTITQTTSAATTSAATSAATTATTASTSASTTGRTTTTATVATTSSAATTSSTAATTASTTTATTVTTRPVATTTTTTSTTTTTTATTPGALPAFTVTNLRTTNANDTWRIYNVRTADKSVEYLEIGITMPYNTAQKNMRDQIDTINKIINANKSVNVFIFTGTAAQDMPYYNDIIPANLEPCMNDLFEEFHTALAKTAAGVGWLDIDTFEKRLLYLYKTDHHWNARGAYKAYTQVIDMMSKVIPKIGSPLPLKGITVFPNVQYRGSRAQRTQFDTYYDVFSVMDIELPPHTPRVTSQLANYQNGSKDAGRLNNKWEGMYDGFYNASGKITFTDNRTGRNLLLIGDSFASWVSFLIGSHFDVVHTYMTHAGRTLDYNKFIKDNAITDVLILQYAPRMVYKSSSAAMHLEQIRIQ